MYRKVIKLILILLVMLTIFLFSSDNGIKSTKKSDIVIVKTTQFFLGKKLSGKEYQRYIESFVVPVRKSAHFFIYFVLGILMISFVGEFRNINYIALLISISICFLYACSDEVHQLFVSGRSGEACDVFIDTFGSFFGVIIYFICYTKYRKVKEKKYE